MMIRAADALAEARRVDDLAGSVGSIEPNWALGDVTGKGLFTHIAMYHAAIVVKDILGQDVEPADYTALPRVTFTDPEIGAAGLTESKAREQGIDVAVGMADLSKSARGWIHKAEGFIKLVMDKQRGVLVGATSAGSTRACRSTRCGR
jgi:pyruvate/2-oxoglutarate dehydrogenase complex dihydrolipoamide dehydrogenase (E3) component